MALPCEKAIWNTLPKIRADLARELVKRGIKQKDIAEGLCLTPSAVSQYIHNKRGGSLKKSREYNKAILKMADKIEEGESEEDISDLICHCCFSFREKC